jgi:putative MATE family efflux protein
MAGPRTRDLTEGPITGHLLALGLPTLIGVAAIMSVSVADAYYVGRLGQAELAAISFCFPVTTTLMSVGIGLSSGASSVVARAAGRRAGERIRRLTEDALILSMLTLGALAVLGWLTVRPFFRALGAEEDVLPHIAAYMHTWYAALIFMGGAIVINGIIRALGDANLPALVMVGASLFNVVLAPLLIFGIGPFPVLGVQGAALATLIAQFLSFCVFLGLLAGIKHGVAIRKPSWPELKSSWAEIARVGAPAAISNSINPFGITLATASLARFGAEAVAGFGVATRIETFALVPLLALSAAIGPVTGQNGGAGCEDRVKRAFAVSFAFSFGYGLLIAAALGAGAIPLTGLFSDNAQTLRVARLYLWMVPVTAAGYGVVIAASAGFNALGWPMRGLSMTLIRSLVLYAPGAWIGGLVAGPAGAIVAIALTNVLSGAGSAWWTLRRSPMAAHEEKRA